MRYIKRIIPYILVIFLATGAAQAQLVAPTDSLQQVDIIQDSLLSEFFLSKYLKFFQYRDSFKDVSAMEETIPLIENADSIYKERLQSLSFVDNFTYNDKVKNYIDVYVNKRRKQVQVMLALSQYYFPIFEEALDKNGVPTELKYLPIIESALNPYAVSRAGASGLWQFMPQTGKLYDLRVGKHVDERYDPEKASNAAAIYLRDLYNIFNDWTLALAAYNCGPGNVNKAIKKAKGKKDFWEIYEFLPAETRGYVPAFIGATYAMNYYQEHGLYMKAEDFPLLTDTVMINQDLKLDHVASVIGLPLQVIKDLNPQYKNGFIPGKDESYSLRLPVNFVTKFIVNQDSIYVSTIGAEPQVAANRETEKINYRVKKGDNLGAVAHKYQVTSEDIKKWNHLKSNMLKVNQNLVIYTTSPKPQTTAQNQSQSQKTTAKTYTVKKGDTLYAICSKNNLNIDDVVKLNNLKSKSSIYPGQVLKLK